MSFNSSVSERLAMIAKLQDLLGLDRFRAISHERASRAVEGLPDDLATLVKDRAQLLAIDGIGPKIADKIIEFATTGRMSELDELAAQVPAGVLRLLDVPGLGPKTAAVLWKQGGIESLDDLKREIDAGGGKLLELPRMGAKSIQKLKESLDLAQASQARTPLGIAMVVADDFVREMLAVPGVQRATFAGSLRRGKDTVGDIDVLVCVDDLSRASEVARVFRSLSRVRRVITSGDTRCSVRAALRGDGGRFDTESTELAGTAADGASADAEVQRITEPTIQVDLRVLPIESWGAALMYFTGSKEHNIRLRERAQKRGQTLTDYGLFPDDPAKKDDKPPHERGVKAVAGRTEEDVYAALELPFVPPEIREDRRELELAATPRLIELEDILAELHAHTTASDGTMSIVELAEEAKRRGFHTIAVTDHSKSSAIAGGLSIDDLEAHIEEIHKARERVDGISILAGSEVDILADGSLDYPDDVLSKLDVVVASPHTALGQDPAAATKRLLRAIEHPLVHIIGHPTGRLVNRRAGLSPDMHALIAAAAKHRVALEINAHWMRLDLRDVHVHAAADAGCLIAIDCDVHAPEDFDNLRFGVTTARRGWLKPELCVNTWTGKRLHAWLASKREG